MDLEEKENPEEKIDGNEKTDLQIEDTGKVREDFRTLVESVVHANDHLHFTNFLEIGWVTV